MSIILLSHVVVHVRHFIILQLVKYIRFVTVRPTHAYIYIYLLYNFTGINNLLYRIIPPTTSV